MQLNKPLLPALLLLTSLVLIQSGCAKMTGLGEKPKIELPVVCAVMKPVYWSTGDSDATIRQAKEHNAVWSKLCGRQVQSPKGPH